MKKSKHNKYKNTAILFEILSRMVVSELLNGKQPTAYGIINEHFKPKNELFKELSCYQSVLNRKKLIPVDKVLEIVMASRSKLNEAKLNAEKYKLIGSIRNKYDLNEFFASRVTDYKLLASIYNVFEGDTSEDKLSSMEYITEHLNREVTVPEVVEDVRVWREQSPDIQKLSLKLLIEKYNAKYKNLNESQRTLLSKYISDDVTSVEFKNYIYSECAKIQSTLTKKLSEITDPVLHIKLTEAINLIDRITVSRIIKDEHLTSMLKYYELITKL